MALPRAGLSLLVVMPKDIEQRMISSSSTSGVLSLAKSLAQRQYGAFEKNCVNPGTSAWSFQTLQINAVEIAMLELPCRLFMFPVGTTLVFCLISSGIALVLIPVAVVVSSHALAICASALISFPVLSLCAHFPSSFLSALAFPRPDRPQ